MDSSVLLMLAVFTSAIGTGYFVYGKKQQKAVPLLTGMLLCVYPYFVSNIILFILIGIGLCLLPYFVKY